MCEWKEVIITDLVEKICVGFVGSCQKFYCGKESGVPMIRTTNLTERGISFNDVKYISHEFHKKNTKSQLKCGDILVARHGDNGKACVYNSTFEANCLNAIIMRPDSAKINPKFFIYQFNSPLVRATIESMSSGSVQDVINTKQIAKLSLLVPERNEQDRIASVLSSLDDKIDLLHRQNQTLESMAETLFRQWFVKEAEEGWEAGTLGDIANNARNTAKVGEFDSDCKYVALEHIERRNIALKRYSAGSDVSSNKYYFEVGDILFGKLRPYFHKVCFTSFSGICSTDILVIRPKNSDWFLFCLFAFFQNGVIDYANLGSGGTRMPRTDWKTLALYPIAIPYIETLKRFNEVVFPSLNKIQANLHQIRTLEKLHDTLLPKLMSGEVRVQLAQAEAAI